MFRCDEITIRVAAVVARKVPLSYSAPNSPALAVVEWLGAKSTTTLIRSGGPRHQIIKVCPGVIGLPKCSSMRLKSRADTVILRGGIALPVRNVRIKVVTGGKIQIAVTPFRQDRHLLLNAGQVPAPIKTQFVLVESLKARTL